MTKPNVMGNILDSIRQYRAIHKQRLIDELWERNGMGNPKGDERSKYKIEDVTTVDKSGSERTSYRLWKLVDENQLLIKIDVKAIIENKKEDPGDETVRKTETDNSTSPI